MIHIRHKIADSSINVGHMGYSYASCSMPYFQFRRTAGSRWKLLLKILSDIAYHYFTVDLELLNFSVMRGFYETDHFIILIQNSILAILTMSIIFMSFHLDVLQVILTRRRARALVLLFWILSLIIAILPFATGRA